LVDLQDLHVDRLAFLDHVADAEHALMRELGDMDHPLDPRLELDEGPELHDLRDLAADLRADVVLLLDLGPGAFGQLAHGEADLLRLGADLLDLDLHLLATREQAAGVLDASPAERAHMQQAVAPAEIDEGPEVADVADDSIADLTDGQLFHG